jgi:hypothetical protein
MRLLVTKWKFFVSFWHSSEIFELKSSYCFKSGSDGHKSVYELNFLAKYQPKKSVESNVILWNRESIQEPMKTSCRFSMNEVMSGKAKQDVLKSLLSYGVAFVDGVPPTVNNTEFIVRQMFPIKESFLGKMWTLTNAALEHPVSAYTKGVIFYLLFLCVIIRIDCIKL